jgi:hypothetical protein
MASSAALGLALAAVSARAEAEDTAVRAEDPAGTQELGAQLGLETGGRVSPGGFHLLGNYLYRLSDEDWFDAGLSFTIGGGAAACFRDRDNDLLCDHGIASGVAFEASAGVRRFFAGQERFSPYLLGALGARLVSFGSDDLTGFAVPLLLGGGIRARVADRVSVIGAADLRLGPAWFNRDLGAEPHITLSVHAGAEFRL